MMLLQWLSKKMWISSFYNMCNVIANITLEKCYNTWEKFKMYSLSLPPFSFAGGILLLSCQLCDQGLLGTAPWSAAACQDLLNSSYSMSCIPCIEILNTLHVYITSSTIIIIGHLDSLCTMYFDSIKTWWNSFSPNPTWSEQISWYCLIRACAELFC